jgi:hypothetical protein
MVNLHTTRRLCFAIVVLIGCASLCDGAADQEGEPVKLERYGVSFRAPKNWFVPERSKIVENIRKLDSEKEDISAILASHRGSITIATYLRHDPRGHAGMIPTINVLGRSNPHSTFEAFRKMIAASSVSVGSVLRNYVVKASPAERTLAGRRVVVFAAEYDISTAAGADYRVSSTTYAIPCGEIFLQISMSESIPAKQSQVFERFIGSFAFKEP